MAGLAPPNLRLGPQAPPTPAPDPDGIIVEVAEGDGADAPEFDDKGAILRVDHPDGSVTISLDGRPISDPQRPASTGAWFDNLCDKVDQLELGRIAEELIRGIDDDKESRREWVEARKTGIQLLGLKLEVPGVQGASDGAPVEGMSKVRDSLLLEAVLRFQANARSELLPTDGPVKVRDDATNGTTPQEDATAGALQTDMNHYLTAVATEYYPDTDRMLLMLGFGGTSFKKVYKCPLRNRPVSESVDAEDLIVNQAATDLKNAKRVTHRVMMRPSTVKRLQILGVYRDVDLPDPMSPELDEAQREKAAQQGVRPESARPEDRDREIYECYCELDIKGFEHRWKGKASGLEVPYRVTIDVSSKQILSVCRNYNKSTEELPEPRVTFVKYTYVPGLGFYDIGLMHILGNMANALTAAEREMLDNGMFANFPGFLVAKQGSRQNTTIFRVPPGGGQQVDTNGGPIGDAVMPLPYNTQQMPALMALVQALKQDGQRIGGVSELQVGEGRPDAPVGTTLAMIDQATKIENSVHKRLHAAQAEEFRLLVECFRENPETFWQRGCASPTQWDEQSFLAALDNCDLVPQADPNTASHAQRVMKVYALKQLQASNPSMYDPIAIDTVALQTIGWSNPEQFFVPPTAMQQPPPEMQEIIANMEVEKQKADADTAVAHAKVAEVQAKAAQGGFARQGLGAAAPQQPDPAAAQTADARLIDAQTNRLETHLKAREMAANHQDEALDRQSKEKIALLDMAREIMREPQDAAVGASEVKPIEKKIGVAP